MFSTDELEIKKEDKWTTNTFGYTCIKPVKIVCTSDR